MYVDSPSAVGQGMTASRSGETGGLTLYCEVRDRRFEPSSHDGLLGIQVLAAKSLRSSPVGGGTLFGVPSCSSVLRPINVSSLRELKKTDSLVSLNGPRQAAWEGDAC